jgi:threonine/homoserine/homoserine lactone efflux protein
MELLTQTSHLWLFAVLVFGIVVLPGMDMAFVLGTTLTDGLKGGFAALVGVILGGMVHTVMASLGVGLVVQEFPQLFNGLLIAGALYLIWIGVQLMQIRSGMEAVHAEASRPWTTALWRGVMSCLLNPKAYLFMVAVFPQFVRAEYGSIAVQATLLGGITALTQLLVYGAVAVAGRQLQQRLKGSGQAQVWLARAVGMVLIAGALISMWQGWRSA